MDGSVIPGMVGLEAGQSAFGDVYAWFKDLLSWPLHDAVARARGAKAAAFGQARRQIEENALERLSEEAAKVHPAEVHRGCAGLAERPADPFADQTLKGAIVGLTLGTTAPKVFRALVEATAFGSRAIVQQFRKEGVPINAVIAQGESPARAPSSCR